jgi:hypothetical protein
MERSREGEIERGRDRAKENVREGEIWRKSEGDMERVGERTREMKRESARDIG